MRIRVYSPDDNMVICKFNMREPFDFTRYDLQKQIFTVSGYRFVPFLFSQKRKIRNFVYKKRVLTTLKIGI